MNEYDFHTQNDLSKIGTKNLINYYKSLGIYLHSVEYNKRFHKIDID